MLNVTRFPASPDQEVPLRATNEKIAKLAAAKPAGDIHSAFVLVAQLVPQRKPWAWQLNWRRSRESSLVKCNPSSTSGIALQTLPGLRRCDVWVPTKLSPRPRLPSCFFRSPARGSRRRRKQLIPMGRERWWASETDR